MGALREPVSTPTTTADVTWAELISQGWDLPVTRPSRADFAQAVASRDFWTVQCESRGRVNSTRTGCLRDVGGVLVPDDIFWGNSHPLQLCHPALPHIDLRIQQHRLLHWHRLWERLERNLRHQQLQTGKHRLQVHPVPGQHHWHRYYLCYFWQQSMQKLRWDSLPLVLRGRLDGY